MSIADDIHTILNGLVQPRDVQRVCQMVRDLESQLAAVRDENRKLHDAYTEQENRFASLQEQIRYHATATLAAVMPEERP